VLRGIEACTKCVHIVISCQLRMFQVHVKNQVKIVPVSCPSRYNATQCERDQRHLYLNHHDGFGFGILLCLTLHPCIVLLVPSVFLCVACTWAIDVV
jgi:hypothetical protein